MMRHSALELLVLASASLQAQVPVIADLLDSVRIDSMVSYAEQLSGEVPVDVGNGSELILFPAQAEPGQQAWPPSGCSSVWRGWVTSRRSRLERHRRERARHHPGTVHPGRKVVFCAHYDAMPGGFVNAPAARTTTGVGPPPCWRRRG